jgi:hypothetical protein
MSARAKVRRLPVELIEEPPSALRLPPGRPVARGAALPVPAAPARPAPPPKLAPEREGGEGERGAPVPALPVPAAPLPALKPEREEGGRIPPEVLRRVAEIRRRIRELEEEERRLLAPYAGA